MRPIRLPGGVLIFAACIASGPGRAAEAQSDELFDLSLDQLMQIHVTSVSRRPEELRNAPSAIYVVTGEDIRRSGVTSIPEALRLVPGMQVRRAGSANWSISARGFDRLYANKLLVMIDGRTVYSPTFGGVYWDAQDTVLEDIDRIEVIRGPGAVMWGANAVNGVINIITRHASETTGTLVSVSTGTEDHAIVTARQGASTASGAAWRAWVKATERDDQQTLMPDRGDDGWQSARAGFRYDSADTGADRFTLQGDLYANRKGIYAGVPTVVPPYTEVYETDDNYAYGANLLGRWLHQTAPGGELRLQLYYDNEQRRAEDYYYNIVHTTDLEIQHVPAWLGRHSWIWGGGVRYVADELQPGLVVTNGSESYYRRTTAFFQYGYEVIEGELDVTLGSKFEYNDFNFLEPQPSVRALWRPRPQSTWWLAYSRAVRTPGRSDQDAEVPLFTDPSGPDPVLFVYRGHPDYDSEVLNAYEWGWRERWSGRFSTDLAVFYNDYDDERITLLTDTTPVTGPPDYIDQSVQPFNDNNVSTWGFEYVLDWQARRNWQLQAWYSFLRRVDYVTDNPAAFPPQPLRQEVDRDAASLRSYWVHGPWEVDSRLRYVDSVRSEGIDAYTELDLRIARQLGGNWRASLALTSLLDDAHREATSSDSISFADTEVERAVLLSLEWRSAGLDRRR